MTTTTPETDTRIEKRLAELMKLRAERRDADDLPGTMTQRERNAYLAETALLDNRINAICTAAATLAALPTLDADTKWLGHLHTWRKVLSDELMSLSPMRDRGQKEQADRLVFCLRIIDFGFGIAKLPVVDLSSLHLGALMAAAGYETQGEALRGPRGFLGGIKEVEHHIKALTKQRAKAQAALDPLLLSDEERDEAEAESQDHRDALNTMVVKGNADGTGLVAFTKDGDPLSLANMTPVQKAAFTRFEAAAYPPREPVEQ